VNRIPLIQLKDKNSMQNLPGKPDGYLDLVTFYIGDACCGIDILQVQEINRLVEVTCVPLAPEYVKGIINLRGQITTVIDLGKRLGLPSEQKMKFRKNIIVCCENEFIGLLVDSIDDVVSAERDHMEKPPLNMNALQGQYVEAILKTEKQLISILNLGEVLG